MSHKAGNFYVDPHNIHLEHTIWFDGPITKVHRDTLFTSTGVEDPRISRKRMFEQTFDHPPSTIADSPLVMSDVTLSADPRDVPAYAAKTAAIFSPNWHEH